MAWSHCAFSVHSFPPAIVASQLWPAGTPTENNDERKCHADGAMVDSTADVPEKLGRLRVSSKLQTLDYDILLSTTAVFSYAIGSRKLSANEQFFVGAQTVVSLLQTTQIKQGVSVIATNGVYTSTNKTTIV